MSTKVQRRRGTTAEHSTFTGAVGELTVDTDKDTVVVHDGSTAGGAPLMREDGSNSSLALGSAASPSLKWDANTGIYSPGADQVAISTNGTERLRIDSSGRVGIGTASPVNPLSLSHPSDAFIGITNSTAAKTNYVGTNASGDLDLNGSGSQAILFKTAGNERVRIDSSGRLLVGTSTSVGTISGIGATLQVSEGLGVAAALLRSTDDTSGSNLVFRKTRATTPTGVTVVQNNDILGRLVWLGTDGTNPIEAATIISQVDGTPGANDMPGRLVFSTTADGALSPTERLRIDSQGRVGIGTTSAPAELSVTSGADLAYPAQVNAQLHINKSTGAAGLLIASDTISNIFFADAAASNVGRIYYDHSSDFLAIHTDSGERARIDSSGRLLVGSSSALDTSYGTTAGKIQVVGTQLPVIFGAYSNDIYGGRLDFVKSRSSSTNGKTIVQNNDNLGNIIWGGTDGTNVIPAARIDAYIDGTPGANDMPGRLVFSTTADGASNPTERMRIMNNGTVLIGATTNSVTDSGFFSQPATANYYLGLVNTSSNSAVRVLQVNRQTSDGNLVDFLQANTLEGTISVSGTTVTYGGGHLARWSQLPNDEDPSTLLKGTVMSNLDEMCEWSDQDNEQLNRTKVSDVEGDPNVAGVFVSTSPTDDGLLDFFVGMTGDMIIRIAEGVTVQRGDLLMSAGDGTAKPQGDDIIRSKTVAKVTSTNVACTYDDGSYCVPCVLMAC